MKKIYMALCVLGLVLPYFYFIQFLLAHGLNLTLLMSRVFSDSISAFFGMDVIVSSVVFWVFIFQETRKRRISLWWVSVVANLVVGLSLGLPLFLWLRERAFERSFGDGVGQS